MKIMDIFDFRQQCLSVVDELPGEGILITRHGEPVAKLLPARGSCVDLIGKDPAFLSDHDDDLFTTGIHWDAES